MESTTLDGRSTSLQAALPYVGFGVALVCVVFFPMLFDASYPRIINTILLVGICGLVLRTAVSPSSRSSTRTHRS